VKHPPEDELSASRPIAVVIGGPNGAGKSTLAAALLPAELRLLQFVNADTIAIGLAAYAPETVALKAGRILLDRLGELARQRQDFAVESTLASRSLAPFLRSTQADGYVVKLVYVWLDTPDLAVARVAERVLAGGHDVPEETVRRRYRRSLANFRTLYRPLADEWTVCDNSGSNPYRIAHGGRGIVTQIVDEERFLEFESHCARS
jgi:predicted ABC-type ATPase